MIAAGEKLLGALAGWRGYAAAAFAGAAVAWIAQGWRYGAEIAELQRQQAEERRPGRRPWPQSRRPEPREAAHSRRGESP